MSLRRIRKELKDLRNNPIDGCSVETCGNDMYHWNVLLLGPENTAYEDGIFQLDVVFSKDYPFKAPTIKFVTKILHFHFKDDGRICWSYLEEFWSPALNMYDIFNGIISCLKLKAPSICDVHCGGCTMEKLTINQDRMKYQRIVVYWMRECGMKCVNALMVEMVKYVDIPDEYYCANILWQNDNKLYWKAVKLLTQKYAK